MTTLIAELQAAAAAEAERTATNLRLSRAIHASPAGSPERAAAEEAWTTARKDRPAEIRSVLEARDKLADFCLQVELMPDAEPTP